MYFLEFPWEIVPGVISSNYLYLEGGKFLKKLRCCVGGEYYKIIWFYQLS